MSKVKEIYVVCKRDLCLQDIRCFYFSVGRYVVAFCLELLNLCHICVKETQIIRKRDLCQM